MEPKNYKRPTMEALNTKGCQYYLKQFTMSFNLLHLENFDFHRKGAEVINLVLLGSLRGKTKQNFTSFLFIVFHVTDSYVS